MRLNYLDLFALFTFSCLPIVSLSVVDADYLPVTGLLTFLPGLILALCFVRRLPIDVFIVVLALFYFVLITLLRDVRALAAPGFLRELTPILVGVGSYCFIRFAVNKRNFLLLVKTLLFINFIIIIYGIIEMAAIIGLLPIEIKKNISLLLTGSVVSRLQLVFPEASWAGMYLAFIFPFVLFFQNHFKKVAIVVMGALFLATFSLYAYIVLAFGSATYFIFLYWRTIRIYKWLLGLIATLLLAALCAPVLGSVFEESGLYGYHYARVAKLISLTSLEALITVDGSFYIRIMYPFYGAIIGAESIFGVGFVDYGSVFNSKIENMPYGAMAQNYPEARGDILTETADPRAFFISFLAFGGIPGILLFVLIITFSIISIKRIDDFNTKRFAVLLLSNCLVMCFQFGSLAFSYIWLSLAIPHCLKDGKNNK